MSKVKKTIVKGTSTQKQTTQRTETRLDILTFFFMLKFALFSLAKYHSSSSLSDLCLGTKNPPKKIKKHKTNPNEHMR